MATRSKLVRMHIVNVGCIGPEGLTVELDNIVCFVGANNCGKSTILRAYELAVGTKSFSPERDLCHRADGKPASVELWVHIPPEVPNIAARWKTIEDGLHLVQSRWEWNSANEWEKVRQTWDPEKKEYGEDKASGLDTVFSSRLPKPFRIGALDDPDEEHKKLLTLVLQPIIKKLEENLEDKESDVSVALQSFLASAKVPVEEEKKKIIEIQKDLNRSHNKIFPDLAINFDIGLGEIELDPADLLLRNSQLKFDEWASKVQWQQQGTGSQRALFWTMLQVRSKLSALNDVVGQKKKEVTELQKKITKLEKEIKSAKTTATQDEKRNQIIEIQAEIKKLSDQRPEEILSQQQTDLSLPGYMLLIDEPEIALHPGAVRAASKHLYGLAEDGQWQVMLTTHSPAFIDPLHDHTTIVRLDRSKTQPTPNTYRSDKVKFDVDEMDALKMLNRFDQALAEMFFGHYPILIEGDTEFAAFEYLMHQDPEGFPLQTRPLLVRARGKWTMRLLIKILTQFKVSFSILHDSDSLRTKKGTANGAWTANIELHKEIEAARKEGIRIVHRVSVPNFENTHLLPTLGSEVEAVKDPDKPWNTVSAIKAKPEIAKSVKGILADLLQPGANQEPYEDGFEAGLKQEIMCWVKKHNITNPRYQFESATVTQ